MSLLTMVQNITKEIGLPVPTAAYASSDPQVYQIIRFLVRTADDLRNRGDWPELLKEHTITLVDGTAAYAFPADFDRIHFETEWNDNSSWPLYPMNPQEYELRVRGILTSSAVQHFIAKGSGASQFTIYPTPGAGEAGQKVYFIYQSAYWVQTAAGVDAAAFAADTDISLIYEPLMEIGAKWRFKAENGLDYGEDKKLYMEMLGTRLTAKKSARTLRLVGNRFDRRMITTANLPEGTWG